MRASHGAFKVNNKRERTLSESSHRRVNSYKDFKEDSTINHDLGDDVVIGGSKLGGKSERLLRD